MNNSQSSISISGHEYELPHLPKYEPKQLTNSQKSVLEEVIERLRVISRKNSEGDRFLDNFLYILGERGSGKTTLLYALMRHLNGEKDPASKDAKEREKLPYITLPPIDPEMFNGDTKFILAWVFLRIEEKLMEYEWRLSNRTPCFSCEHGKMDMREKQLFEAKENLAMVKESLALVGGKFRDHVKSFSYSSVDFQNQIVKVQQSGLKLVEYINKFLDSFFRLYDGIPDNKESKPLLLVTFDDIDMIGPRGASLLKVLNTYLRHDRVVILLLGAISAFKRALHGGLLADLPDTVAQRAIDDPYFYRLSNEMVQKYMRPENVFSLSTSNEDLPSSDSQDMSVIEEKKELWNRLFSAGLNSDNNSSQSNNEYVATEFRRLLHGSLRHKLAFYDWFNDFASVRKRPAERNEKQEKKQEHYSLHRQRVFGLLNRLIQLLVLNSTSPDFEELIRHIVQIDPVDDTVNLDMVELARIIDRARFYKEENPNLVVTPVVQDPEYLVLSVCFVNDVLDLLERYGLCHPSAHNGGVKVLRRSTLEMEKIIVLFFFSLFWNWLKNNDMPLKSFRIMEESGSDSDSVPCLWSTISAMARVSTDKTYRILEYLQSEINQEINIRRINSYLNSSLQQLSNDPLAKTILRCAMVLSAFDVVIGEPIDVKKLLEEDVFWDDSIKKRILDVFDVKWQVSFVTLSDSISSGLLGDSPLLPAKDEVGRLHKSIIKLFSFQEPKRLQLKEFLERISRGEFVENWLVWAYQKGYIIYEEGIWYLTNEGEMKLESLRGENSNRKPT